MISRWDLLQNTETELTVQPPLSMSWLYFLTSVNPGSLSSYAHVHLLWELLLFYCPISDIRFLKSWCLCICPFFLHQKPQSWTRYLNNCHYCWWQSWSAGDELWYFWWPLSFPLSQMQTLMSRAAVDIYRPHSCFSEDETFSFWTHHELSSIMRITRSRVHSHVSSSVGLYLGTADLWAKC